MATHNFAIKWLSDLKQQNLRNIRADQVGILFDEFKANYNLITENGIIII